MSISDEQIGRNLARLRGDLSQAELAIRMRDRGYKWSQATVWSIEKGERPLRLTEAEDVAEAIGVSPVYLTLTDEFAVIESDMRRVSRAHIALKQAIKDFQEAQLQLMMNASMSQDDLEGTDLSESILDWLRQSAATIDTEVRLEGMAEGMAERQVWAYLDAQESGTTTTAEQAAESDAEEGQDNVVTGPYADAFNAHFADVDGFRFIAGPSVDD